MGVKLSSQGNLTFSQKKGKSPEEQRKLFKKLSKLDINKPILKAVAEAKSKREEAAKERREQSNKILAKEAAQKNSANTSKPKKNSRF